VQSYRRTGRLPLERRLTLTGRAAEHRPIMPDTFLPSLLTELDPLATPFETRHDVDLLLHDLNPAAEVPNATAAERTAHRASLVARRGGKGRAALVVDSTPIARAFLMQRLQALGYDAHGADTGEQALAMIEQQTFALVFLELVLTPKNGIDGLTLCQVIKQKSDHRDGVAPAVIVTTGQRGSSDKVRGSLAGCDAYLTKPLIEEEFLNALREVDPMFK